ncbi:MAG: hypothetical protein JWN85_322 [Gammaproteobacteria bacterium]|nr:hypothetical protein [Gammaproteobacteria bacterium]
MNEFRRALDEYLAGRHEMKAVERELNLSLARHPPFAAAHGAYVEALFRGGHIGGEIYLALVQTIRTFQQSQLPGSTAAGVETDKTQLRALRPPEMAPGDARRGTDSDTGRDAATAADDADKTRFRAPQPFASRGGAAQGSAAVGAAQDGVNEHGMAEGGWAQAGLAQIGPVPTWSDPNARGAIKGRFVLDSELGSGSLGVVFRACDLRKEEAQDRSPYVAIKILNDTIRHDPAALQVLQSEARKAQSLAHPNVVAIHNFHRDETIAFLVMELLEGERLDRLIQRVAGRGLATTQALRFTRDICGAMAYAHGQGVVHTDFKPSNAFLTREGVVKVFDFAIARARRTGAVEGSTTPAVTALRGNSQSGYASCELLQGLEPDPRDDVYAVACVTYELLTGKHPFDEKSAIQARAAQLVAAPAPGLSRGQWRTLQKGLAFQRAQRPASALEFLNGIRPPQRAPTLYLGMGAAAVAVVVIAAVVIPGQVGRYREQSRIAALATGSGARIEPLLPLLRSMQPTQRNAILANEDAHAGLIRYFEGQIAAASDVTKGKYDFPRSEALAAELTALLPDSAAVKDLSDAVFGRKNDEIKRQSDRFDADLARGLLIEAQGPENIEAVLAIVRRIDPGHPLLHDPRLPIAHAAQARLALQRSNPGLAQGLVDGGLRLHPDDATLRDLHDETQRAARTQQLVGRVAELEGSLGALLAARASLTDYEARRPAIAELRSIAPHSAVLAHVQEAVQRAMEREIQEFASQHKGDDAQQLLSRYADLASPEFVEGKRQQLRQTPDGRRAAATQGATPQRDVAAAAIEGRIDALVRSRAATEIWDAELNRELQQLGAYLPPADPYVVQVKAAAAAVYLDNERLLRREQRLAEAGRMLERARGYAPQSVGVTTEDKLLAEARERQSSEVRLHERLAQLEALKQKLIDQAQANEVTEAQASLTELRANLPADDAFMTQAAPEALARSYLRLAASAARDGRFENAVTLVDHAAEVAPGLAELAAARERYVRYAAFDQRIAAHALTDSRAIRAALEELAKLDKEGATLLKQRLGRALANRGRPAPVTPAPVTPATNPGADLPAAGTTAASDSPLALERDAAESAAAGQPVGPPRAVEAAPLIPGVACKAGLAGLGRRKQGICFDGFAGGRGPDMVVIVAPLGGRAFAMGRTEVSNADYSLYCLRSGRCSRTAGLPTYPVTAISLADAQAYVEWLSQVTGASYRLPADAEWMYAIRAQHGKAYRSPANCVSEFDDNRVRSSTLHAILSGTPNNWGLYNYTGNAQEWVRAGSSVAVRGGAYVDNASQCRTSRPHSGSADPITGFRLLRELK